MKFLENDEKPFVLPMHTMFSLSHKANEVVAHALDFDLVAVAKTEDEAVAKIRMAVKRHIEFGLNSGYERNILYSAPAEYWAKITPESSISIGEALEINHVRMITQITGRSADIHELEQSPAAA